MLARKKLLVDLVKDTLPKIGKTLAANIIKHEAQLRSVYKFQGKDFKHIQRHNHQKYKAINDILYSKFKKRGSSSIDVNGPLLKEDVINIKEDLSPEVTE